MKRLLFFLLLFTIICSHIYAKEIDDELDLSRIYVEPGYLEPEFSETRTYYTLLLDKNVDNLIVQATPKNEELKYTITGNENLKEGENLISITVYSSDNQKSKTYTINALKTDTPDEYNALLSTLVVDNYPFNEDFFPEVFEYTLKDTVTENKLDIYAYPQIQDASVNINGNTNLKHGNNTITINVTSKNGLASRDYRINVERISNSERISDVSTNTNKNTTQGNTNQSGFKKFIFISLAITVTLSAIILYISRNYKF